MHRDSMLASALLWPTETGHKASNCLILLRPLELGTQGFWDGQLVQLSSELPRVIERLIEEDLEQVVHVAYYVGDDIYYFVTWPVQLEPILSQFLRLSLVHCSFKVKMLSRGVDCLMHS